MIYVGVLYVTYYRGRSVFNPNVRSHGTVQVEVRLTEDEVDPLIIHTMRERFIENAMRIGLNRRRFDVGHFEVQISLA